MRRFINIILWLIVVYMVVQIIRTWGFWETSNQYAFCYEYGDGIKYTYEPNSLISEEKLKNQETLLTMDKQIKEQLGRIDIIYYDIPLSHELQDYTNEICSEYNFSPEIIYSMMYFESSFRTDIISKTNDYGIMQINQMNHSWLREAYGIDDFLDPEQNILCGVIMISDLYKKYEDIHKALMAYNCGEAGAKKLWNQGYISSEYSRKIVEYAGSIIYDIKTTSR